MFPNRNELDPTVRAAMERMLDAQPSSRDVASSLERLRSQRTDESVSSPVPSGRRLIRFRSKRRGRLLATACCVVFLLGVFATTDVWAEVARDYSIPSNEPKPIVELGESATASDPEAAPSWLVRFTLLAHVISLTLALLAMLVAWVSNAIRCLVAPWKSGLAGGRLARFERRSLISSILLYSAGILLGCGWSRMVWGRWWSWDPRESFGLFTVAIAILWLKPFFSLRGGSENGGYRSAIDGTRAAIAFCSITLMYLLAQHYAALQQGNHNFPPISPTGVLLFFAIFSAAVWTSGYLARVAGSGVKLAASGVRDE